MGRKEGRVGERKKKKDEREGWKIYRRDGKG